MLSAAVIKYIVQKRGIGRHAATDAVDATARTWNGQAWSEVTPRFGQSATQELDLEAL